jgi:hypothetical protein
MVRWAHHHFWVCVAQIPDRVQIRYSLESEISVSLTSIYTQPIAPASVGNITLAAKFVAVRNRLQMVDSPLTRRSVQMINGSEYWGDVRSVQISVVGVLSVTVQPVSGTYLDSVSVCARHGPMSL